MKISYAQVENLDLGLNLDLVSPLPWTIDQEYEQKTPGYYIFDALGNVLFSEDVEPTEADRNLILALLLTLQFQ